MGEHPSDVRFQTATSEPGTPPPMRRSRATGANQREVPPTTQVQNPRMAIARSKWARLIALSIVRLVRASNIPASWAIKFLCTGSVMVLFHPLDKRDFFRLHISQI